MKKLYVFILVLALTACNNDSTSTASLPNRDNDSGNAIAENGGNVSPSNPSTGGETSVTPSVVTEPATDATGTLGVFAGVPAKWTDAATGSEYDGRYDAPESMFKSCPPSAFLKKVQSTEITNQEYASCDAEPATLIQAYEIKIDGSFTPLAQPVEIAGDKAYIKVGAATRIIALDQNRVRQIEHVKQVYIMTRPNVPPPSKVEPKTYIKKEDEKKIMNYRPKTAQ